MNPITASGTVLDADFHVEMAAGRPSLVLESRSGRTRNPDYNAALELLLRRLKANGAVISDAIVDSSVSRAAPFAERRLQIRDRGYPLQLEGEEDISDLRVAITAAEKPIAQRPHARGGNRHKRIRLFLAGVEADGLEVLLAGGTAPDQQAEEAKREVERIAAPRRAGGQGRGLNAAQRKAVELRAVAVVSLWLQETGWDVSDIATEYRGYDLHALRGEEELHVEVKGTIGSGASVILTPNEVRHAREHPRQTALAVVIGIELTEVDGAWQASGGSRRHFGPWRLQAGVLKATEYEWVLPPGNPAG